VSRGGAIIVAVLLATALSGARAAGGGIDEATRRQLEELKALCDAGLVAPPVCREKQRAILGLPARGGAARTRGDGAQTAPPAPGASAPAPGPAQEAATAYESPLGFRMTLPAGWTEIAAEQMDAGFDALRSRADGNPDAARLLERLRAQGTHREAGFFAKGRDSLHVMRSAIRPPEDPAARAAFCERLDATTSKAAGRRLRTYACSARMVSGVPAFHVERDALLPATRTMQYWLPDRTGSSIHLVMTCRDADADERRREMEGIVESLRWR
jgi:hypothetical protein